MLTFETKTLVDGITGREIFDFLANPNDREYQLWWPGVHLQLHTVSRADGYVGDVIFMDEYVGARRLRLTATVLEADPGKRLLYQLFKAGIRLPAWLEIDFADEAGGVMVTHRVRAGWEGWGRRFDPLLRLYFSPTFVAALDAHVRTEFPLLRERLHPAPPAKSATASVAASAPERPR